MRAQGVSRIASIAAVLLLVGVVAGCCCPKNSCCPCDCDPGCNRVNWGKVATAPTMPPPAGKPAEKTLFERLGGIPALTAATDDFLPRLFANATVMGNAVVKEKLMKADAALVRQRLIDQLCNLTGGPCAYTGKDMKTAHTGLGITEAEWNAAAEELAGTLKRLKVPDREAGELLAIIGGMKGDIVGH